MRFQRVIHGSIVVEGTAGGFTVHNTFHKDHVINDGDLDCVIEALQHYRSLINPRIASNLKRREERPA